MCARRSQRGAALAVALIMLVLITLMTIATFNIGKSSLEIVGNMQSRNAVTAAADAALEEAISIGGLNLFLNPNAVFRNPSSPQACGPAPTPPATWPPSNQRCYDLNGDGITDVNVDLSLPAPPFCKQARAISNSELNLSNPNSAGCTTGVAQQFGIAGVPTGNSLCADVLWEVNATATDAVTAAQTVVTEGVTLRVANDNIQTYCPNPALVP